MRRNLFGPLSSSGFVHPVSSDITPQAVYTGRRAWLKQVAAGAAGASLAAWASRDALAQAIAGATAPNKLPALVGAVSRVSGAATMEKITAYADASTYNNFYEFGTDKADPAKYAHTLQTKPWTVEIEGLVKKPGRMDLESLLKLSPMEERIYRMRCVEGWSMVIPWIGYSLSELVRRVEPLGSAKFVEFTTLADAPSSMAPNFRFGNRSRNRSLTDCENSAALDDTEIRLDASQRSGSSSSASIIGRATESQG